MGKHDGCLLAATFGTRHLLCRVLLWFQVLLWFVGLLSESD